MNNKKNLIREGIWYFLVFVFLYIWFTRVHPLVIFDADDWTYLAHDREAWPIWGEWNPGKVFPEVFMPLCATVGNFLLMPLVKDYVTVMTMTHGFVVSLFITVYVWSLARLLERVFSLDFWAQVYAGALFLVLHFLALRSGETNNQYLFFCKDVNCYYNYLIPALLNASIVLWMVKNEKFEAFRTTGNPALKGIFYLVLYMALFSNLVDSVILAVYAGAVLLVNLLKRLKSFKLKPFVKAHGLYLVIFATWFVAVIFEMSGGRAGAGPSSSMLRRVMDTAYCLLFVLVRDCNKLFLLVCCLMAAGAVALFFLRKRQDKDFLDIGILWLVGVAAMVFCMIVLCAMVNPATIYRSEYSHPVFFYCLVLVLLCYGYLVQKQPKVLTVVPILLCVLLSATDTQEKTFQESNMGNMDPALCADISRDLLAQAQAANEAGLKEMTLYVPVWDTEDNWPQATQLMNRMRHVLYAHGLIGHPMEMTIVASEEVNQRFHLDCPIEYTG